VSKFREVGPLVLLKKYYPLQNILLQFVMIKTQQRTHVTDAESRERCFSSYNPAI
jgi:hypothetical protein